MNDELVTFLDSSDERLLDYLDEDEELAPDIVKRLQNYASALLDGSLTPAQVLEDWADFYDLATGFVLAYGTEELEQAARFVGAEEGGDVALSDADRPT